MKRKPFSILLAALPVLLFSARCNADSWQPVAVGKLEQTFTDAQFSPDGKRLLIRTYPGYQTWKLWDFKRQVAIGTFHGLGSLFSFDGSSLIVIDRNGRGLPWGQATIKVFNAANGKLLRSFGYKKTNADDDFEDAGFVKEGRQLLLVNRSYCRFFDFRSGQLLRRVSFKDSARLPLRFLNGYRKLFYSPGPHTTPANFPEFQDTGWSPDGKIYWDAFYTANPRVADDYTPTYRVWNASTRKLLFQQPSRVRACLHAFRV